MPGWCRWGVGAGTALLAGQSRAVSTATAAYIGISGPCHTYRRCPRSRAACAQYKRSSRCDVPVTPRGQSAAASHASPSASRSDYHVVASASPARQSRLTERFQPFVGVGHCVEEVWAGCVYPPLLLFREQRQGTVGGTAGQSRVQAAGVLRAWCSRCPRSSCVRCMWQRVRACRRVDVSVRWQEPLDRTGESYRNRVVHQAQRPDEPPRKPHGRQG